MKKLALLFLLLGTAALLYGARKTPDPQRPTLVVRPVSRPVTVPSQVEPGKQVVRARIENYYLPRYEQDELIYEARGKAADVYGEERADLEDPRVTWFGRPSKESAAGGAKERTSVAFSGGRGKLDRKEHTAVLESGVHVEVSDGTRMATELATARFQEKTVSCPLAVLVEREAMEVSGTRLEGKIDLEEYHLRESVRVLLRGTDTAFLRGPAHPAATGEAAVAAAAAPDAPTELLTIRCGGELHVLRLPQPQAKGARRERLVFHDRVLLTRQELQSVTTTLESDLR
ncbi:MAG: LPS export ABC transporter periplasmic protein LptC, partial [Planctomycetes bacterium]|nr:LPS export ABC transporter periplasmic protein LptC [Planctomycetota bacterium]